MFLWQFGMNWEEHLTRESRKPVEQIECPFCDGLIPTAFPIFWRHITAHHAETTDGIAERKEKLSWARSRFEIARAATQGYAVLVFINTRHARNMAAAYLSLIRTDSATRSPTAAMKVTRCSRVISDSSLEENMETTQP